MKKSIVKRALNDKLLLEIEAKLKDKFRKVKISDGKLSFRKDTTVFNSIVDIVGTYESTGKNKIEFNYETTINGWFWLEVLFGFLFWPMFVFLGFRYFSYKESIVEDFETLLKEI